MPEDTTGSCRKCGETYDMEKHRSFFCPDCKKEHPHIALCEVCGEFFYEANKHNMAFVITTFCPNGCEETRRVRLLG